MTTKIQTMVANAQKHYAFQLCSNKSHIGASIGLSILKALTNTFDRNLIDTLDDDTLWYETEDKITNKIRKEMIKELISQGNTIKLKHKPFTKLLTLLK